ncbi:MAG: sensor histidine kinase [Cellulosilyticaceae bacterium]
MTKFRVPLLILLLLFGIGTALTFHLLSTPLDDTLDIISINRIQQEVANHWGDMEAGDYSEYTYDFSVIDLKGTLLYQTRPSLDASLTSALKKRLPIVDVIIDDQIVGKILIHYDSQLSLRAFQHKLASTTYLILVVFCLFGVLYLVYLHHTILKPFQKLQVFAKQVASGNLDLPLNMDKHNVFGAFTESFDLMRHELQVANQKAYEANQSKKELVASLSHDIKTPVTGIKLITELLLVTVQEDALKKKIHTIYEKAEQINHLITDMFHATLADLGEFHVAPSEHYSTLLETLIDEADYEDKVRIGSIPPCMVYVDSLRLSQVVNNIIYNAYKYGGPHLHVTSTLTSNYLEVRIHDDGDGVSEEALPLLFNKFYRGDNATSHTGTGLGLYIAKQLMNQMEGDISCSNTSDGFTVLLLLKLI